MSDPAPQWGPYYGRIHLEATSRTRLRCRTSLFYYFEDRWQLRDLDAPVLKQVLAVAHRCRGFTLGGWGDPLLRGDAAMLVRVLKQSGLPVSVQTDGTHLAAPTEVVAQELIATDLDALSVFFVGADARRQDAIRGEGTFEAACRTVTAFSAARHQAQRPYLSVRYLLTDENLHDIPDMIHACIRMGADALRPQHLIVAATRSQERMLAHRLPTASGWSLLKARLSGHLSGLEFTMPPMGESLMPVCALNPVDNLFIAADGSVSPCIYLNPPIEGDYPLITRGKRRMTRRLVMGNLHHHTLDQIWTSDYYRLFRRMFRERRRIFDQLQGDTPQYFQGVDLREITLREVRETLEKKHPAPRPCRSCPHLQGY